MQTKEQGKTEESEENQTPGKNLCLQLCTQKGRVQEAVCQETGLMWTEGCVCVVYTQLM